LFNVGVAGFVGIGAYVSALLTTPEAADHFGGFDMPIVVGWAAAAAVSGLASVLLGALTVRLRSDYLAIATFGFAVVVQLAALNLQSVTAGPFGISFIPRPFGWLASDPLAFGLLNLATLVLITGGVYFGLEHLMRSPWGRVLRAIREDEAAATALGKDATAFRIQAFAVGGAIMGLAGAVQGHFIGYISPDGYVPILTFQVWAMLIVGGSGNNRGAILGAIVVWALWAASGAVISAVVPPDQQARASALKIVMIGVGICLVLLLRPRGILGELKTVSRHVDDSAAKENAR
jgi:branched-chain amino acid transport system permease protein